MIQYPTDWVIQETLAIMPGVTMDDILSDRRCAPNLVGREVMIGCMCEFCALTPTEAGRLVGITPTPAQVIAQRFGLNPGSGWTLERVRARLLKRLHEGKDPAVPAECRRAG